MQRRSFLKTGALAGSAFLFSRNLPAAATGSDEAGIEIMLDEPLGTISPLIYSHFTEELGAVIYDGVWVGEKSKIPNTGGIRTAIIALAAEAAFYSQQRLFPPPSKVVSQLLWPDKDRELGRKAPGPASPGARLRLAG